MSDDTGDTVSRLHATRTRMERAARDSGRSPADARLVVISKTQSAAVIKPVLAAGHRQFGENRVQEAETKWRDLRLQWPDTQLHLVGPLQTNKARAAVALFDVIQTLDRTQLAAELAKEMARQGRNPQLFVQVNTGAEPQKAGILPQDADAFLATCARDYGLKIAGLMCIPPAAGLASPHFALLLQIARRNGLTELSMGMSADFEMAIQLGATLVRVGSAIFGERPPH